MTKEKNNIKMCIYQSIKKVHESFWKKLSKANAVNMENRRRIKDRNERLALEEVETRRIWKEYLRIFII